jgi:hypothetical protein
VERVIQLNRMASYISTRSSGGGSTPIVGAEPGIDPRRHAAMMQYGHIREECTIDIMEYSTLRFGSRQMRNEEFVNWVTDEQAFAKQSWVKVRWIHIEGISWDVISALALKYGWYYGLLQGLRAE